MDALWDKMCATICFCVCIGPTTIPSGLPSVEPWHPERRRDFSRRSLAARVASNTVQKSISISPISFVGESPYESQYLARAHSPLGPIRRRAQPGLRDGDLRRSVLTDDAHQLLDQRRVRLSDVVVLRPVFKDVELAQVFPVGTRVRYDICPWVATVIQGSIDSFEGVHAGNAHSPGTAGQRSSSGRPRR